jgi:ribosome-associated protein
VSLRSRDFLGVARAAAGACADKKAEDVRVFDARRLSGIADYYVLASVASPPQMLAVREEIDRRIKSEFGLDPLHREGRSGAQWTVLDYGGAVVHVMHRSAREFYGLERLWEGARPVQWESRVPAPPQKRRSPSRRSSPSRRRPR